MLVYWRLIHWRLMHWRLVYWRLMYWMLGYWRLGFGLCFRVCFYRQLRGLACRSWFRLWLRNIRRHHTSTLQHVHQVARLPCIFRRWRFRGRGS